MRKIITKVTTKDGYEYDVNECTVEELETATIIYGASYGIYTEDIMAFQFKEINSTTQEEAFKNVEGKISVNEFNKLAKVKRNFLNDKKKLGEINMFKIDNDWFFEKINN